MRFHSLSRLYRLFVSALLLCLTVAFLVAVTPSISFAEDPGALVRPEPSAGSSGFSFFGLFKSRESKRKVRDKGAGQRAPKNQRVKVVIKEKDPDASAILVVGDEMADGLANGLRVLLAEKTTVRVEKLVLANTGLIAGEADGWIDAIEKQLASDENIRAVVFMLGHEDQQLEIDGLTNPRFGSFSWRSAYRKRAVDLIQSVREQRKSVVWVGLPPTSKTATNSAFATMNAIYKDAAEAELGYVVDIWDVFLNDKGEYSSYGPDVDGKNKLLRTRNSIGFTQSGYQKVAFFVERRLSRILGGYGALAFEGVQDDPNFIVLTGRTTSPETELLGGSDKPAEKAKKTAAYQFFVEGEALPGVPGRVDDTGFVTSPVAQDGS
ncbi:MAG: DUF459 domain-containing protein [Rhodobacteraceae bacterium]|nr:DUF459 domain-containing protein [Paracoccaceae bacterium]